ncbi:MAG: ABC transporter permease [Lachnospiraceae bacterium]
MKKFEISKGSLTRYFSLVVIVCLVVVFTLMERSFLNISNINNLLSDTAPLMIMAAGMMPIILIGSIDLSVGAMCSVANVMVLSIIMKFKDTFYADWFIMLVAFTLTILFSILAGMILGVIHVKLKVPSFIASLAFMSIWNSIALLISNSPVSIPKNLWGTINWYKISLGPLGLPLILVLVLIVVYYVILTRTPFGRGLYAIGGNERAARMAGIPVDRIKITAFAINGFCVALGAIFLMAKAKSSAPTVGDSFTLMVISAVVLGGTALIGGSGNILTTILGVFIVSIIKNGMNIVSVNVYWQKIVFGLVVLIAIAINTDRSSRSFIVK